MNRNAMITWMAGGVLSLAATVTTCAAADASASQPGPSSAANAVPASRPAPTWSEAEFQKIASMMTGSWRTTTAVAGSEGAAEIVISAAPVYVEGVPDVMYVEVARADAMHAPYRQTLWQFYKGKGGKTHLKTIEFRRPKGEMGSLIGMWAAPEAFPAVSADDLVATLDMEVVPAGAGFTGKTLHPYPTSAGGAVEMTSEFTLTLDSLQTTDRGFGPDGKVVWGSSEGQAYTYKKFDPDFKVERLDGGLVVIDFVHPAGDTVVQQSDKVTVQYSGYLANGFRFDTSRDKPQPFTFTQGTLIPGWNVGLDGATKGTIRRLAIPPAMAYGDRGAGRTIPPGSPLYFDIEILAIERPAPVVPEQPRLDQPKPDQPAGNADPHAGHSHGEQPQQPKKPE